MRPLPGRFTAKVVGVSFVEDYPANLLRLEAALANVVLKGAERPTVLLVREPDNPHDPNAVAVDCPAIGRLGHLPRSMAERLAPELDAGAHWLAQLGDVLVHPDAPHNPGITVECERSVQESVA